MKIDLTVLNNTQLINNFTRFLTELNHERLSTPIDYAALKDLNNEVDSLRDEVLKRMEKAIEV